LDISDEADPPDSELKMAIYGKKIADISADTDPFFKGFQFLFGSRRETFRSMLTPVFEKKQSAQNFAVILNISE
jgi:hypothetical protein